SCPRFRQWGCSRPCLRVVAVSLNSQPPPICLYLFAKARRFQHRGKLQGPLTQFKGRHGQDAREHPLIVAVQDSADARKGGDAKDLEVLEQGARTTGSHEGLAALERRVVKGDMVCCRFATHAGRLVYCLEPSDSRPLCKDVVA